MAKPLNIAPALEDLGGPVGTAVIDRQHLAVDGKHLVEDVIDVFQLVMDGDSDQQAHAQHSFKRAARLSAPPFQAKQVPRGILSASGGATSGLPDDCWS